MPTSKTIAIVVLSILLIGSNVAWAGWMFDTAITVTHTSESIKQLNGTLDQVFAMLPKVVESGRSKAEILEAAKAADPNHPEPAKGEDGGYSVGWIVLWFDGQENLIKVTSPIRGIDP